MLLWYRIFILLYAGFLGIVGLHYLAIPSYIFALIYNTILFKYWDSVIGVLRKWQFLIVIDILISLFLWVNSGVYKSPYFLYIFSPIMMGSFIGGYFSALWIASLESVLRLVGYRLGYYDMSLLENFGEHVATYMPFFFLVAFIMAYVGSLLKKLDLADRDKTAASCELEEARKRLKKALAGRNLSNREIEVLIHAAEGRNIDEICKALGVSQNTIKTYFKRIYAKLGVSSKQEALSLVMNEEYAID
jgi:DNA-binding CsgD family transcriptional regulator